MKKKRAAPSENCAFMGYFYGLLESSVLNNEKCINEKSHRERSVPKKLFMRKCINKNSFVEKCSNKKKSTLEAW